MTKTANDLTQTPGYRPGETDTRPWGMWEVLETGIENGEEYCIKTVTVNPGGILSLQSHQLRREHWTVLEGTLEVTKGGEILTLQAGESIELPCGIKHRAANRGIVTAVFKEIQRGICREDDNTRYEDIYGRANAQ